MIFREKNFYLPGHAIHFFIDVDFTFWGIIAVNRSASREAKVSKKMIIEVSFFMWRVLIAKPSASPAEA